MSSAARRVLALVAALAVLIVGCQYEDGPWQTTSGKPFPYWRAACVEVGMTRSEVLNKIGPPLQQASGPLPFETWRYQQTRRRVSVNKVLGIVPWKNTHEEAVEVTVTFDRERAVKVDKKNVYGQCGDSAKQ